MSFFPSRHGSGAWPRAYWAAALVLPPLVLLLWVSGLRYAGLAAAALAAVPFLLAVMVRPLIGYLAVVFVLFSNLDSYLPVPVFSALLLLTLLSLLVGKLASGERRAPPAWLAWGAFVYLLLCVQSLLVARDEAAGWDVIQRYLKAFALVYVGLQVVRDRISLEAVLGTTLAATLVMVVVGYAGFGQAVREGDLMMTYLADSNTIRYAGLMGDANFYAMGLVGVLPLCWALLYRTRRGVLRVGLISSGLVIVIASALSFSRGGFVALAVVLGLSVWHERRRAATPALVVAALLGLLVLIPNNYWDRVSTLIEVSRQGGGGDHSVLLRLQSFLVALRVFAEHPLTGVGVGQFLEHVTRADFIPYRVVPHNLFLDVLVSVGLPGLVVFLFLLVRTWRTASAGISRARSGGDPRWGSVVFYVRLGLLGVLVAKMFLPSAHDTILWQALALAVIAATLPESPGATAPDGTLRPRPGSSKIAPSRADDPESGPRSHDSTHGDSTRTQPGRR